jgi:hypothetical protein
VEPEPEVRVVKDRVLKTSDNRITVPREMMLWGKMFYRVLKVERRGSLVTIIIRVLDEDGGVHDSTAVAVNEVAKGGSP